jgi:hypothetical protein
LEFSFNKEPGIVLIKHLSSLIPAGADMHCYFASGDSRLFRADYKNSDLLIKEIKEDDDLLNVTDIRKPKKIQYNWEMDPEALLNVTKAGQKNIQFSILQEDDHLVLSMRFLSQYDGQNDVIYIFFRSGLGIFGIETSRISLNAENKTLIANILYKSCTSVITQAYNDRDTFRNFTLKTRSAIDSVKVYKDRLKQLSNDHHKNMVVLARNFISGLSESYGCSFEFTDECIESLKDFSSDLPRLQSIVENAAIYAYNLNSAVGKSIITIEEEYLQFTVSDIIGSSNESSLKKKVNDAEDIYRIEIYLNNLENAVKRCIANKEKPTGENVAVYMEPARTSASITIYLKKYSSEVNTILDSDPTKFPQSRKNFKPLQNIILDSKLARHTG